MLVYLLDSRMKGQRGTKREKGRKVISGDMRQSEGTKETKQKQ